MVNFMELMIVFLPLQQREFRANVPKKVTIPPENPKNKQWSGKNLRKLIRGADAHKQGAVILDAATAISLFSPGL